MMKNNIIQESTSPWQSPVYLCKKASGDYRFAVDYRALNKLTEPESYPVPLLGNIFDTISAAYAKFFTALDLASGFWQIPMDPLDRHKTSFASRKRTFEFLRMPFGLRNTPTTYQRRMCKVFQGLNWKVLLVYMDDIIDFSSTFEEHLDHLKQVFERLQDANPQGQTLQAIPCGLNSLAQPFILQQNPRTLDELMRVDIMANISSVPTQGHSKTVTGQNKTALRHANDECQQPEHETVCKVPNTYSDKCPRPQVQSETQGTRTVESSTSDSRAHTTKPFWTSKTLTAMPRMR